jgi:hypothetical protein
MGIMGGGSLERIVVFALIKAFHQSWHIQANQRYDIASSVDSEVKNKAIPVAGHAGLQVCFL